MSAQEISEDDYTWLARLLRRHARAAQGVTHEQTVARVNTRTGTVRKRKVRRRVRRFAGGNRSGFVSVNNGPDLAADLARALSRLHCGSGDTASFD